ncbi:hypothetical protein CMUS01_08703 [Colletotrichum musicola]|uniref:Uncharacterized protein n=1 Tax=Colletotrichum musicola TaxID=2175873 RepID=A0A8H6KBZ5_9PEZI|nr:hypothetical protein CMUS01_08703 [Colletotrichum musicola]
MVCSSLARKQAVPQLLSTFAQRKDEDGALSAEKDTCGGNKLKTELLPAEHNTRAVLRTKRNNPSPSHHPAASLACMQPGSSVVFNAGTLRRCTRPLESSTTTRLVVRAQPAQKPTVRASPRSPRTNANVQDSSTSDDFLLPGSSSQARSSHCPGATVRRGQDVQSHPVTRPVHLRTWNVFRTVADGPGGTTSSPVAAHATDPLDSSPLSPLPTLTAS